MRLLVLLVEKAARENYEIAHLLVLGAYSKYQRILDHASAEADAIVRLKHRGGRDYAGHLRQNSFLIFACQKVVVLHLLDTDGAATGVLDFNLVGADLLDLVQNELRAP